MSKLRERLALLLTELRTWHPGYKPPAGTAEILSAKYLLEIETVAALARSEGFELQQAPEPGTPLWVDPDKTTDRIDVYTGA